MQRRCLDGEAIVLLSDGITSKRLRDLQVGDKVKTIDWEGQLVDTDVIMIMDSSDQSGRVFIDFTLFFIYFNTL